MTPQGWVRLKQLFGEALDLNPADREKLLERLDREEPAISEELKALLAEAHPSDPNSDSLGSKSIREFVASLGATTPEHIGGYRIAQELGRGGSSIVFRAFRESGEEPANVAIKVLRFADWDEARMRQFSTERRILAQLNHPNIARMFSWGNTPSGLPYLVMEFVEGKTLTKFCTERSISLSERLSLFKQVLQAVAFAHERSIIHRDLKPANILVTSDQRIKLLDFGISKLFESDPDATATIDQKFTPSYASPEQIQGVATGPASDIYSLGVILYELATGRLPYQLRTRNPNELSLAVLKQRPIAPSRVCPELPRELDSVLLKALEKAPANRYSSAQDFAGGLNRLPAQGQLGRPRDILLRTALICGVATASVLAAGWLFLHRVPLFHGAPRGKTSLESSYQISSSGEFAAYPALSPVTDQVAYASDRDGNGLLHIWLQDKAGSPVRRSSGTADDSDPAFSPDGKLIAFHSEREPRGIYVIPALGGSEEFLVPFGRSPRFATAGKSLLYWIADPYTRFGSIWRVSLDEGKEPYRIARDFEDAHNPVWTPDGRFVLFCGTRRANGGAAESHDFWVAPEDGSAAIKTGAFAALERNHIDPHVSSLRSTSFQWLRDGLLFAANQKGVSGFWILPISRRTWKIAGDPYPVSPGEKADGNGWRDLHPAIAGSRAAFARAKADVQVWNLPVNAEAAEVRGPLEQLTRGPFEHLMPSISFDGCVTVFLGIRNGHTTVYSRDYTSGSEEPLPGPAAPSNRVKLSGDGRYAFRRIMEGAKGTQQAIYRTGLLDGRSVRVCDDCGGPTSVSFDGSLILYENGSAVTRIGVLDTTTGEKREIIRHPYHPALAARLSPDGRWVVFSLDRGLEGRQLFVCPFHSLSSSDEREWVSLTPRNGNAEEAAWSPGGRWIYYFDRRDDFRCLWARQWEGKAGKPAGDPVSIQHFHTAHRSPLLLMDRAPRYIGLSVARDRVVMTLSEFYSQVWRAKLQ